MTVSVAGLIAYASERGTTVADDPATASALVRAQDYIAYHYVNRFSGAITIDESIVDDATYEAAIVEIGTPGFWTKTYTPDQQKVLTEVDGIKWTIRGDASGSDGATPVSTKIEGMLRPFMVRFTGVMVV